ncbi:hypothetical protein AALP_AA4G044800 [Arabis alpina]|uniref:B30.2/SPRY domain-containing protein n=1 Tax=Arabis alpina TaxID=50452 RepID=A0A087H146_ARAAL|nr:hypothetical protein AALP_AA4G044800 [Arabis alpina]
MAFLQSNLNLKLEEAIEATNPIIEEAIEANPIVDEEPEANPKLEEAKANLEIEEEAKANLEIVEEEEAIEANPIVDEEAKPNLEIVEEPEATNPEINPNVDEEANLEIEESKVEEESESNPKPEAEPISNLEIVEEAESNPVIEEEEDLIPQLSSTTPIYEHEKSNEPNRLGSESKIESDSFSEEDPTAMEVDEVNEEEDDPPTKKQKLKEEEVQAPEAMVVEEAVTMTETTTTTVVNTVKKSKSKKKNNNVWVTKSTRKGKKKSKTNTPNAVAVEDKVLITPIPRFPDKSDDTPELEICLSRVYKAEKVEISEDRLSAGSSKGYRMVRATRGAIDGAWYFEIKVVNLGETGHTRLGWSTDKGDLQAPVGYDGNSFGFRDIDGCKIHKALREKYGEEGYKEGDVIGFYINLPDGESFAPKPPHYVWYKGQRYVCAPDVKEEPPQVVPGSEISFFKNGVCQGVAFSDLLGGRYYPAASMYTLPDQSNCVVKFNFGPDFESFPEDFGGRATPKPMCEVPYHGYNGRLENNGSDDMKS